MEEKKEFVLGYDLSDEYTQIYSYNWDFFEAEPVEALKAGEEERIPTVLFQRKDTEEWFFGKLAEEEAEKTDGIRIRNFVHRLSGKEEFSCYMQGENAKISAAELMMLFFRKTLSLTRVSYPDREIRMLVVTLEEADTEVLKVIYEALALLGLERDRVRVRSHKACFAYYTLNQEKEILQHDVGLFELKVDHLYFYQLHIDRKFLPAIAQVSSMDLTEQLLAGEPLVSFENAAKVTLHRRNISTLFMVGKAFSESWAQKSLMELCVGRRLFIGQNLYAKGACYYARELIKKGKIGEYAVQSEEMVEYSIFLEGYYDAKRQKKAVFPAGIPWYDAREEFDVILDHKKSVSFSVENWHGKKIAEFEMVFSNLKERPGRMTRMRLLLFFTERDTMVIQARDRGFGAIYPGTNRIYEETVRL